MPRAIDHLVLPVTALALARSRLTSLGFTVAPDARHPFGTGNCCVFFSDRTFLEPVTVLDRPTADAAAAEGAVFVERLERFMERHGEGFAMLALRSADAEADQAEFERLGVSAGPLFRFTRRATLPDGSEREVGFALAFADAPEAPDTTFFACQHLAPGALFQPAYLEHPNGAVGVSAVVAVAADPAAFRPLLAAAVGRDDLLQTDAGLEATVDGQAIVVATPAGYRERLGLEADAHRGPHFAAVEVTVSDIDIATGHAGPTAMRHAGRIVVPPAPGLGAALAFGVARNG